MITGVWSGKINKQKVEIKIIQNGDSLTGSSYYYESANNYRRYSIKGYFDPNTNAAVWWDDQLIEEKSGKMSVSIPGKVPLLSRADFNCPGGGKMMLDGKAAKKEDDRDTKGDVHLDKITESPKIIQASVVKIPEPTIEQKFITRKKILTKEIPITGDSIELRFYDNAEIDGDSISLFLNDQLIFQHIRLTGNAYIIKLAVSELKETNELIMVAENLGSIPPNTSYMVAVMGDKRYDARLESTEGSSAMIRLKK